MGSLSLAALLFCGRIRVQGVRSASARGLVTYSLTGMVPSHRSIILAIELSYGPCRPCHFRLQICCELT